MEKCFSVYTVFISAGFICKRYTLKAFLQQLFDDFKFGYTLHMCYFKKISTLHIYFKREYYCQICVRDAENIHRDVWKYSNFMCSTLI